MKFSPLQKNDTILILSPAKAIERSAVDFAKYFWEKEGFKVKIAPNTLNKNSYFSGTKEQRAMDFQNALEDEEVKAIICSRGGYGCIHLLDLINTETFKKNPKWIIGFSDVTVFHFLQNKLNIPSIHATMPLNYGDNSKESLEFLKSILISAQQNYSWSSKTFKSGEAEGEIIGGNLSVISDLIGTSLTPDFENKILFIEEVGEHFYVIDRMFYQLKMSNVLNELSGIIIGDFSDIKDTDTPFGKGLNEIIEAHLTPLNIPYAFDFPAGHCQHNLPLIFGLKSYLEVENNGNVKLKSLSEKSAIQIDSMI